MPASIINVVDSLPTIEEKIKARLLWNRSLPVSANVAIIEFNRVAGEVFRERVGEDWWRNLEWFARELNVAAKIIRGEALDKVLGEGKEPEMEKVGMSERRGKEPETQAHEETGGKAQETEIRTLDHLAEAAALPAQSGEVSATTAAKSATGKGKEHESDSYDEATEAAIRLLSLSSTSSVTPSPNPFTLASSNALSALWLLINRFFSAGPAAASYFFVALEAAIRANTTTIYNLNIPAPPSLWAGAVDWTVPKVGMTLLLTLASSKRNMFDAFARYSKTLGPGDVRVEEMRKKNSASLRKAVLIAKAHARDKGRTTVLGVGLRDVLYTQLCEVHGRGIEKLFASFERMFVLGVCEQGAKLWLVGEEGGQTGSLMESNERMGAGVGEWDELDEFVRDFEGVAVASVG